MAITGLRTPHEFSDSSEHRPKAMPEFIQAPQLARGSRKDDQLVVSSSSSSLLAIA